MNFSLRCSVLSVAAVALLSGCGPTTTASPEAASAWANSNTDNSVPKPSESPALSAQEQVALDQAVEVVMGYRQTITDLYSGAATRVADLDKYLSGDKLIREKRNVEVGIRDGRRATPMGVKLREAGSSLIDFRSKANRTSVTVGICTDATDVISIRSNGSSARGVREFLNYSLVISNSENSSSARPIWLITSTTGSPIAEEREC